MKIKSISVNEVEYQELYRVAVGVAKSKPKSKDNIIRWLEKTFTQHLINYPL